MYDKGDISNLGAGEWWWGRMDNPIKLRQDNHWLKKKDTYTIH